MSADGCAARVSFHTAPWLDVRCHRPPGHDGLHEAATRAPVSLLPHEERSRAGEPALRESVWLSWAQEVPPRAGGEQWLDRHGDVWTLGADGLLHTPETRPFHREHVERKWGPLRPAEEVTSS